LLIRIEVLQVRPQFGSPAGLVNQEFGSPADSVNQEFGSPADLVNLTVTKNSGGCWWRLVDVGRGKSSAAEAVPAEGGEASLSGFSAGFCFIYLARPATSERGAADLQAAASAAELLS
jgi:hypothetical protein